MNIWQLKEYINDLPDETNICVNDFTRLAHTKKQFNSIIFF